MSNSESIKMKNLDPLTLALSGRHIIEASAGTGKTYNIAELYIRLLLDKDLSPKEILVMTFTKDATQEIISRVEERIRQELTSYRAENKVKDENYRKLKKALLEVDEAAIFTIHGFCKKVLSQQAFASGMDMDVSMEVNTDDILLETVEDYFRNVINKDTNKFNLLKANKWHTPEKFLDRNKGFKNIIKSEYDVVVESIKDIQDYYINEKKNIVDDLLKNKSFLFQELVTAKDNKKPSIKKEEARTVEWNNILKWLNDNSFTSIPNDVSAFVNGTRFAKNTNKEYILERLLGLKDIKDLYALLRNEEEVNFFIANVESNQLAKQICQELRANFVSNKQSRFVLDFDDLIVKLRDSLKTSPELVRILQAEYPVALIDEFQDTDSMQYEILDTIYPSKNISHSVLDSESFKCGDSGEILNQVQDDSKDLLLLMIGDPKQAIYGFRGGDIYTYLKAKKSAAYQWSMDTNWRSTDEMVQAYNRLFFTTDFTVNANETQKDVFSAGIDYKTVNSTPNSKGNNNKITFDDDKKALTYFSYQHEPKLPALPTNSIKKALAEWTANEIVTLLNSSKVAEKDIAILVKSFGEAKFIQQSLKNKKISAVYLSQKDSIFESNEAKEILMVLAGINELENDSLLKQALSTSLLGGTAAKLADYVKDGSDSFDEAKAQAIELRKVWKKDSVMTMLMQILHQYYVPRDDDKERSLTNILHLAELIKVAENKYKHPHQLIKWFKQQLNDNASNSEENVLRLESDSNLIKIITIHGSKGLEYPVVFIPYSTSINTKAFQEKTINKYYDKDSNKTVYKIGKGVKDIVSQELIEESMRLLYVAVTRASQRCYIGVANFKSFEKSSLAQFFKQESGGLIIQGEENTLVQEFSDSDLENCKSFGLINSNSAIEVELESKIAKNINIDSSWRILSYSSIIEDNSEYIPNADDKNSDESKDEAIGTKSQNLDYRFSATKGADIGNILHNVLEVTDFEKGIQKSDLMSQLIKYPNIVKSDDEGKLINWLDECLDASIPLIDDNSQSFKLKDLNNCNTLKEPEFHIPLNNDSLWQDQLGKVLTNYRGNAERVELPNKMKLYGMLKGFIDLIFEYKGKFYVADYKSNYLGDKLSDYSQQAMQDKNRKSFYDLQYLIYSVALHRYLKINKSDYDFSKDFGGVYYLYLRGMKDGHGVYQAKPSFEIIESLDKLFAGNK